MTNKLKTIFFSERAAFITVAIGLALIIVSTFAYLIKGSSSYAWEYVLDEAKIGQFGDFIGGVVGSIFSLVGVLLFYIALREQREDFANGQKTLNVQVEAFQQQVKEFEAQRQELTETRKIYEQQNKTMKIQQFDSNFYSLLNVFIKQRSDLTTVDSPNFFGSLCDNLNSKLEPYEHKFLARFQIACTEYIILYNSHRAKLALYFMTFYRLLKIIESSDNLTAQEKTGYHKVVRSLITKEELLLLYYNYQSAFGKKPLPIILKYNYLKHLERLDKCEFRMFEFLPEYLIRANEVSQEIHQLIRRNVRDGQNLETTEAREEITISEGIILGVYVESLVKLKVIIEKDSPIPLGLSNDFFMAYIAALGIDVIYHAEFKNFEISMLNISTLTQTSQTEHNLEFTLN